MSVLAPIAARVEAHAPLVARGVRRSAWKARNLRRSVGFKPQAELVDAELLVELRERGIAVRDFDQVFRGRSTLEELQRRAADPESVVALEDKDFLEKLMPSAVDIASPYAALALEPQVLALANAYVGMRSFLRALDVWRNKPTEAPPKLSQLWHRDYDDSVCLKLFVYLSDVGPESGPFVYAPGTHPHGTRQIAQADRLGDEEMARIVPADEWVVCTGKAGTVVLADTCGYHKGGKPTAGDRLLWTAQYTSVAAPLPRIFAFHGDPSGLTAEQRLAVYER
jgi:hypothetical protein